jgi:hypothetical protein
VGLDQVLGVAVKLRPGVGQRPDLRDELTVGQRHGLVVAGNRDVDERRQQCLLAAEDLVYRLDRDPGLGRDGGQRRGRVAGLDEQGRGRVEDRPARLPSLALAENSSEQVTAVSDDLAAMCHSSSWHR